MVTVRAPTGHGPGAAGSDGDDRSVAPSQPAMSRGGSVPSSSPLLPHAIRPSATSAYLMPGTVVAATGKLNCLVLTRARFGRDAVTRPWSNQEQVDGAGAHLGAGRARRRPHADHQALPARGPA